MVKELSSLPYLLLSLLHRRVFSDTAQRVPLPRSSDTFHTIDDRGAYRTKFEGLQMPLQVCSLALHHREYRSSHFHVTVPSESLGSASLPGQQGRARSLTLLDGALHDASL